MDHLAKPQPPAAEMPLRQRASFHNENRFKIGLFGINCSSGRTATQVPERWSGNWRDNLRLAQMADDAGIDFLLPIGRWKGYGGDTDFEGEALEAITWATGVLATTRRITAFATVHVPLIHPIVAAKQIATADHIGEGRFGLNIVCGWNEDEFDMFGVTQREHQSRYEYAQEWIDAVKLMWSDEEEFAFDGAFVKLKGVRSKPKPYGGSRPVLMNAGASGVGQSFAIRNCDALFTGLGNTSYDELTTHIAKVKDIAGKEGRDLDVYSVAVVTCRPTMQEAMDYDHHATQERADWGAIENIMRMRGTQIDGIRPEELEANRRRWSRGVGGYPIIGDPDHVADELTRLAAAGLKGLGISFVNYADELPFFVQEVLPRLARRGLRAA